MPSRADQISKCDGTKKIEKWKSEEKTCSINVKVGAYVYVTYMSVASLLFFDIGHELYNFYASPGAKNGLFCVFDDLKFHFSLINSTHFRPPPFLRLILYVNWLHRGRWTCLTRKSMATTFFPWTSFFFFFLILRKTSSNN